MLPLISQYLSQAHTPPDLFTIDLAAPNEPGFEESDHLPQSRHGPCSKVGGTTHAVKDVRGSTGPDTTFVIHAYTLRKTSESRAATA